MIHLVGVSKGYGRKTLFSGIDLHLGPGDRVGIVGANGSGKTTLFRLIVGEESPDSGTLTCRKDCRIGYLRQEITPRRGGELLPHVTRAVRGLGALADEREALGRALAERGERSDSEAQALAGRLAGVEERFAHAGGYTIESEAQEVLGGLGFTNEDFGRPLSAFSGGWQMRIELAKLLLDRPDALLLDEPTNHLDIPSMQWFEQYILGFQGTLVLVAHDREFLNRTVNRIVEARPGGTRTYPGNYDRYVSMRDQDAALQERRYLEQQARVREIQDFIDRNRSRKDRARQVQSRIKVLEGMERLERPSTRRGIRFRFPQPERSGRDVIMLAHAAKRYGPRTVFSNLDLTVYRGEKVALVGVNGAGKSTLLRVLAGVLPLEEGTRTLGVNVRLDYYAQHQLDALTPERTVLQEVDAVADIETAPQIRGLLGAFLFSDEDVEKRVAVLSGGEKSRLALARMLLRPVSLLLLDEPTNHLDIESREVLEEALRQYEGTLIFTSHDRRFIDALATKVILVADGQLTHYPGNYSDFEWKRQQESAAAAPSKAAAQVATGGSRPDAGAARTAAPRSREADKQRRREEAQRRQAQAATLRPLRTEIADIEKAIEGIEAEVATLAARMADPAFYRNRDDVVRATRRNDDLRKQLAAHYERWSTLTDALQAATGASDGEAGSAE